MTGVDWDALDAQVRLYQDAAARWVESEPPAWVGTTLHAMLSLDYDPRAAWFRPRSYGRPAAVTEPRRGQPVTGIVVDETTAPIAYDGVLPDLFVQAWIDAVTARTGGAR